MEYIFSIFIIFILIPLAIAGKSMAPWVPTKSRDIQRLLELVNCKNWDKFFEIGCGDGRVSLAVAQAYPGVQVTGIEIAYPIFIIAKLRQFFLWKPNVSIRLANAFKQDFSHYDHIYVYGMPDKMSEKIVPKFMSEAKSWAKLYSYVFSIPEEFRKYAQSYGEENEAKIHVLEKV